MFSRDFYPTPGRVVNQMLMGVGIEGKTVLEPSAGKGNIVDILHQRGACEVLTYEKESDLAKIVQEKSTFKGYDFFDCKAEDISHVDLIVMNPPFSRDEKHILHAWEVAPEGCHIISLCPTNTIENGHARHRKQLNRIIKDNGNAEIELGDCFSTAERKTNVDVSIVHLFKPIRSSEFDFSGYFLEEEELPEQEAGLVRYNEIRELVGQYVNAVKCFDKFEELKTELAGYVEGIGLDGGLEYKISYDERVTTKERFAKELQKKYWKYIFSKMELNKFVTRGVREKINRFVEKQTKYPFTMENIYRMVEMIIGTKDNMMEEALEEAFDKVAIHYKYDDIDNRYHVEGWKTNSHYLVNRKFILPSIVEVDYSGDLSFRYNGYVDRMDDLGKALSWLTGRKWSGSIKQLDRRYQIRRETWYDWGFFEVKFYKKGTMHAKFKDKKVWELFNQRVAKIKGYPLPENVDIA